MSKRSKRIIGWASSSHRYSSLPGPISLKFKLIYPDKDGSRIVLIPYAERLYEDEPVTIEHVNGVWRVVEYG